ncbi:MAG: transposase family protein [Deltaproteobacteria bacterium]|nr:transposase family protein [Deltaproteobacteria bacterium]MBW1930336.1 transposase family protein [Deltaproteobacteria bacterium]MBW2025887.1 transposase family protein [Deltaproteobacteria bacterium]MBW2125258.1 transposase family protein [Deltaproteobacteria bacterium]
MLIESIVRKTLGLKSHCVKRVTEEHGEIVVYLFPDRRCKVVCFSCGRQGPGYDTLKERRWKHVPLWGIPVTLVYSRRKVECDNCSIRVETIPWTQGKSPLSLPLSVVLATWSKLVAWKVIAVNISRPFVVICGHPILMLSKNVSRMPSLSLTNSILFVISWMLLIRSEKRRLKNLNQRIRNSLKRVGTSG